MSITTPVYATRGDVKSALDSKETARNNGQIDQALESASRAVEALTRRTFYPQMATRYFDWPNYQYSDPWRLWLDENELISVTTLTAGSQTISASGYYLEPANAGPPYDRVEINLTSSTASFASNATSRQRAIAITGVFGYGLNDAPAGALSGAINASVTTLVGSSGSLVDVGSIIKLDSERMLVTERAYATSAQTLQGNLTAAQSGVTVAVTTGSAYSAGEPIVIDSETMLITAVVGNNLTVIRAWDGSVLATHTTGATIYVSRTFTVTRGALGTTAASHLDAAAMTVSLAPSLVREATVAEALNYFLQRTSGYARVAGSSDNTVEYTGRGIEAVRGQLRATYGRVARMKAI